MLPKEDWITTKAEIRSNSIAGKGLFAKVFIKEGEEVVRWGGTYVSEEEAQKAKLEGKLIMQFDDDLFSIEDRGESEAYFINHSCNPNLWMKDSFTLQAKRDIEKDEEIIADYCLWETNENYVSKWECKCGSENCRNRVTGKDWRIKELQVKYKDHFTPMINKRIKKLDK